MLSPEAVDLFDRAVLCWLATADAEGRPSVSPKEIFAVTAPDELVIADIASPRSVRNISGQREVCVSAVDVFEQQGYQVYGTATVVSADDPDADAVWEPLRALAGEGFPIRSAIRVRIDSVSRILAPSLWMYPDTDPSIRRASVLTAYGVSEGSALA